MKDIKYKLKQLKRKGYKVPTLKMIKKEKDIEGIKKAALVNTGLLDYIEQNIKAGMTTEQIDEMAEQYTKEHNGICADYQYEGFPKHICTSINDIVCHGIPSEDAILHDGDIINVDATTLVDGYYADASRMFMIGKVSDNARRLVEVTRECLHKGIETIVPYKSTISDIGKAIEKHAHKNGYTVVEEFCGHGVGYNLHEDPFIYHYDPHEKTEVLVPGMVFTIEPMINEGDKDICLEEGDDWQIYTVDGLLSAQWEHTLLVTEEGVEILSW
jgi:methionyl aminopeptidase